MPLRRILLLIILSPLALPPAARSDPPAAELEQNRRKLDALASRPEDMARLRHDASFFLALPADTQKRILDLDREMQKLPAGQRQRLEKTLERYVAWLDQLDPTERQKIKDAPDKETRLKIVRRLREDEWLRGQPAAFRDKLAKLTAEQRAEAIKNRHIKERNDRLHWQVAARFWDDVTKNKRPQPQHLTDFPEEVQSFAKQYLLPRLGTGELNLLKKAEGHWPQYPMALVALADRHPLALPDARGPRKVEDLPEEVLRRLFIAKPGKAKPQINKLNDMAARMGLGKAVAQRAKNKHPDGVILPHELWPYRQKCLSQQVQNFIKEKLQALLTPDEKLALVDADAKGVWPDYPKKLKELAEKHNLRVPWQTLPGPPLLWDRYRITPYFIDQKTARTAP
jgi:hypothetical protein